MASRQDAYSLEHRQQAATNAWATGFIVLAAVLMFVGGTFHVIQGLAALINDDFFVVVEGYAYEVDVAAWGWIHLVTGGIVALTGLALLSGALWARLLAIVIVVGAAMINFVHIPYQPVWSIILLVMDGLILWALLTQGEFEDA